MIYLLITFKRVTTGKKSFFLPILLYPAWKHFITKRAKNIFISSLLERQKQTCQNTYIYKKENLFISLTKAYKTIKALLQESNTPVNSLVQHQKYSPKKFCAKHHPPGKKAPETTPTGECLSCFF
jgi:hypothetical protein